MNTGEHEVRPYGKRSNSNEIMSQKKPKPQKPAQTSKTLPIKIICENRKARFDYQLGERLEAGLVLTGSEVKSLRAGKANLTDAYADIRSGEAFLLQAHIDAYDKGGYINHEPKRKRKLLLHKNEINKLIGKVEVKQVSLIPLKLYFKGGKVKAELALATGKKAHDKRASIKERETNREMSRAMKK
jgi:SsrA-binding protein